MLVAKRSSRVLGTSIRLSFKRLSTQQNAAQTIVEKCLNIRGSLQVMSDKYKGPLEKTSQKNTILPFVFLLGNHSSGKSSFINYIIQRKIQTTGVAPTDDSFTIIVPGPADVDRDGPACIGDPDMGFSGLKIFGPQLIHHTQLKIRANTTIQDFMIVDTPGMIDSPTPRTSSGSITPRSSLQDRGYDFEAVCRWYAERADVILLFFDPDKPGTTGETLSILTNSLVGLEHKLHIILNKADQFRKIHDFARAYGSLCWNLSKVIQRKDLPRIYTMCLPSSFHAVSNLSQQSQYSLSSSSSSNNNSGMSNKQHKGGENHSENLGHNILDLEAAREEVVAEVFNAPKRRIDNEVSRLADSAALLYMHCRIMEDICNQYRKQKWVSYGFIGTGWVSTALAAGGMTVLGVPFNIASTIVASSIVGMSIVTFVLSKKLTDLSKKLATMPEFEAAYKRIYARKIAERDEDTNALWRRVSEILQHSITSNDILNIRKMAPKELKQLEKVMEEEIPDLRRAIGPSYNKLI